MLHLNSETCRAIPAESNMFKIIVDNIERGCYSDNCGAVTVGSAADARVRLTCAAEKHLTIYPMHGGDYGDLRVFVHAPEGMTLKTTEWWGKPKTQDVYPDPTGWVRVRNTDKMIIRTHVIQVISWCGRCGKMHYDCTCGNPRP